MSERVFEIGEIIYVVSNKAALKKGNLVVFPGVIQEEISHKTREGNKTSYKVLIGNEAKYKVIDMAKVDGEIYSDLEEIKKVMTERATEQINHTLSQAALLAKKWYNAETDEFIEGSVGDHESDEKIDPASLLNEVSNQGFRQPVQPSPQYIQVNGDRAVPYQGQPGGYYQNPRSPLGNAMAEPDLMERVVHMPDGSVRKIRGNNG